ncbi:MAG: CRISPR-associated protein Cas4 [Anaerolineales bacterium]
MLDDALDLPFAVTDLKQWVYCPRILYYHHCLPDVRPVTYKMEAGVQAGWAEEGREERRSLRAYGLAEGEREFNVPVHSTRLGLRGEVDMVITTPEGEVIPVDYKLSKVAGPHFKLQLAAYARLLEEMRGARVRRGFLYFIPLRRAEAVAVDARLRRQLDQALAEMRVMLESEKMPAPTPHLRKCVACEFRRFCNDVL